MNREKTLFIIAVLMMVIPHLGLTNLFEQIALFVLGLIVLIFAYGMYFDKMANTKKTVARKRLATIEHQTPLKREVIHPKQPEVTETGFVILKKREDNTQENNFNI